MGKEPQMSSCPAPKESLWERDAFGIRNFLPVSRLADVPARTKMLSA